ncbi:MAG: hypothetical protein GY807_05410 [Gammaproteobacteria bacterium]|nr:hypothetical protein [Gammaproteobacteria bacterium]
MATQSVKFNKSVLLGLRNAGEAVTVKDTHMSGLKFKVGLKRCVFQFEKRISGRKGASGDVYPGLFSGAHGG